jgi:hypothetical protein
VLPKNKTLASTLLDFPTIVWGAKRTRGVSMTETAAFSESLDFFEYSFSDVQ